MEKKYDYLIVGAGLFAAVFVNKAVEAGKRCLVIDKRQHIGGNIYCDDVNGIPVHKYGAHIFHTSNKEVWEYVNRFVAFNRYTNAPLANSNGVLYNLPFNMNTFNKLWGVNTPAEAKKKINQQCKEYAHIKHPSNLEEQALTLCGRDIYDKLIKEYTEKQWGRLASELPAFIIKRLPFRFTYDNNYFDDLYQGIPEKGYNHLINQLLVGADIRLNTDYFKDRSELDSLAHKTLFTGCIDEFYDFRFGQLEYRSLRFENECLDIDNYQGNAVVNYCDKDVPYTRIIEHKHFTFTDHPHTVITREFPMKFKFGDEPYYPINDDKNMNVYHSYKELSQNSTNVLFGGRLAQYSYFDMDDTVNAALTLAKHALN